MSPIVQIRSQPVIATALDIKGAQIEGEFLRHHPQLLDDGVGQRGSVVHLLAGSAKESAENRVHAAFLHNPIRSEKRLPDLQMTLGNSGIVIFLVSKDDGMDLTVTKTKSRRGHLRGHRRIQARVVTGIGAQLSHALWAENLGKIFVVDDMLMNGEVDFPSFLIQPFSVPMWIDDRQLVDDSIVFSHEYRVDGGEGEMLVGAHVTGLETRNVDVTSNFLPWQRFAAVGILSEGKITMGGNVELSRCKLSQRRGCLRVGSINGRSVEKRRHHIGKFHWFRLLPPFSQ